MRKITAMLLALALLLCGCARKDAMQTGREYTIQLEDDYTVTVELIGIYDSYFEVVIRKDPDAHYFQWNSEASAPTTYDLFIIESDYIDYILVDDGQKAETIRFTLNLLGGNTAGYAIPAFEDQLDLKIYLTSEYQNQSYSLSYATKNVRDYTAVKIGHTEDTNAASVITAFKFVFR